MFPKKVFFLLKILFFPLTLIAYAPVPTEQEVKASSEKLYERLKEELWQSLSFFELTHFVWDRYISGPQKEFHYYNSNPLEISSEEINLPATILLHARQSNQGEWIPLLESIDFYKKSGGCVGPIFTFNFSEEDSQSDLLEKIEEVKKLYQKSGAKEVKLQLVGHSLGGIVAAEYAYGSDPWVEDTFVTKVITVASRLRNLDPLTETPYYSYAYYLFERLDVLWERIQENQRSFTLYTMAAENDFLSKDIVLVGEKKVTIPNVGHILVNRVPLAEEQIIEWLFQEN